MKTPTVLVTGSVEREVDPDLFVLTGRVTVRAPDSGAANAALAQRFTSLDHAAMALGADGIALRRGSIYSYGEHGRARRWIAARELSVTCQDTSRAAEVAGALGRVPDVAVEGPYWRLSPTNPAYADVQADAVREARVRAERYAEAIGRQLGELVELRDGGGSMPAHFAAARSLSAYSTEDAGLESMDMTPVPQTVHASVEARWYLVLPA